MFVEYNQVRGSVKSMKNVFDLLEKQRRFGCPINEQFLQKDRITQWHTHTLWDCVQNKSQLEGQVFMGFTCNGTFLISYSTSVEENDSEDEERDFLEWNKYSVHWWSVERKSDTGKVQLTLKQTRALFNWKDLSDRVLIWLHHWPNDQSKVVIHGVDMSTKNLQLQSVHDYESLIDVFPNPPENELICAPCDAHKWSVSFSVPTQGSFLLPKFYRGICNLNDIIVCTNGFSINVVQFQFHSPGLTNSVSRCMLSNEERRRTLKEEETSIDCSESQLSYISLKVEFFPVLNPICKSQLNQMRLFEDESKTYSSVLKTDKGHDPKSHLLNLFDVNVKSVCSFSNFNFNETLKPELRRHSPQDECLEVSQMSLDIEHMIGEILDSPRLVEAWNLEAEVPDLALHDYTTVVLAVCPISFNVIFKVPLILVNQRVLHGFYKSSLTIRWNIVSKRYHLLTCDDLKATSDTELQYKEKAVHDSAEISDETSQFRYPMLRHVTSLVSNVPALIGRSLRQLYCKQQHLLFKL